MIELNQWLSIKGASKRNARKIRVPLVAESYLPCPSGERLSYPMSDYVRPGFRPEIEEEWFIP